MFKNEQGDLIDREYFTYLFYLSGNIKQYHLIHFKLFENVIGRVTLKEIS